MTKSPERLRRRGAGALPVLAWACCLALTAAQTVVQTAQASEQRARIYTCVDAHGRTLTSDRPIPACNDREQRILDGVTGHQSGTRAPSYTAEERREMAQKEQQRQAEQKRLRDVQQRERILLMRYPDEKAHGVAREKAKENVRAVIAGAQLQLEQLQEDKVRLESELEFYQNDISKAPPILRRNVQANQQNIKEQERFIAGKRGEEKRIDEQFDVELAELQRLWAR
ncbi:MAG: DUF4124 domain-containing protein [Comamonadaceae bacterium]|nr:DUF4124 domain-containing protein [Comamonadaceae bacterium]